MSDPRKGLCFPRLSCCRQWCRHVHHYLRDYRIPAWLCGCTLLCYSAYWVMVHLWSDFFDLNRSKIIIQPLLFPAFCLLPSVAHWHTWKRDNLLVLTALAWILVSHLISSQAWMRLIHYSWLRARLWRDFQSIRFSVLQNQPWELPLGDPTGEAAHLAASVLREVELFTGNAGLQAAGLSQVGAPTPPTGLHRTTSVLKSDCN